MKAVMRWIRGHSSRFFHAFGIHCATHQIRLIIISGLVITSLFYPALAIYTSSTPRPLQHLSSRLADSFFNPGVRPFFLDDDLNDLWTGYEAFRISDDSLTRTRCGLESTVRVERLLLRSKASDDFGSINHQTLLSALQFENDLTYKLSNIESSCIMSPKKSCITLSPLSYWSHDANELLTDPDLLNTIKRQQNLSDNGLPVKAVTTFAGRESKEHLDAGINGAVFLAITYFFREVDCLGAASRTAWLQTLSETVHHVGSIIVERQQPWLLALQYDQQSRFPSRISLITVLLYVSYAIFFIYSSGPMKRMVTVHSRIGLVITGLVEILVSTITSLSVCALAGLRITMIPWGIFPVVIVFVGAENMFRLIEDIGSTSITLSVKERVGVGLSKAGTSNTLKVVSYNAILGVIAFFATGAIRQFCVFAIVVLVAHWFLIHTFFVAVLSIDLQRLELNDLIRQDQTLATFPEAKFSKHQKSSKHRSNTSRLIMAIYRGYLRGRFTKNFSLVVLLAIAATLYYATLPSSQFKDDLSQPLRHLSNRNKKVDTTIVDISSPASSIWHILNPESDPLLHLRVEAPIIVTFRPEITGETTDKRTHRPRFTTRTLRPLTWLFKIMILPIGFTLSALYLILLYLLKDTELLEAQRNRPGPDEVDNQTPSIDAQMSFRTLPRASATDIELIATSKDGTVIAYANVDGELRIWSQSANIHIPMDITDLILPITTSSSSSSLTCLAVNDDGTHCAAGTASGVIGLWALNKDGVKAVSSLYMEGLALSTTNLLFLSDSSATETATLSSSQPKVSEVIILTIYEKGTVVRWSYSDATGPILSRISTSEAVCVVNAVKLKIPRMHNLIVALFLDSGGLRLVDGTYQTLDITLPIGDAQDLVTQVHACEIGTENTRRVVVAAVTQAGVLTLWDCDTQECIFTLSEVRGTISRLRLLSLPPKACFQCGEVPMGNIIIASAVGHVIFFDSARIMRRCLCPPTIPVLPKIPNVQESAAGRRSRSNSFVSSSNGSSSQNRNRVSSFSNLHDTADFPISGHGAHSRRNGEKDPSRRPPGIDDSFLSPILNEDSDTSEPSLDNSSSSSLRRNLRFTRLGKFTCERGGWDVAGDQIVGFRRKSRMREPPHQRASLSSPCHALSPSVLERWEVWIFDPSKADGALQKSSLKDLYVFPDDGDMTDTPKDIVPRLPFTRLSPLLIQDDFCIAGFGNTIGILTHSAA